MKKYIFTIFIFVFFLSFTSCSEQKKYTKDSVCLDTSVSITCYGENSEDAVNAAISEINRIELVFSPFIENSEIYNINKYAFQNPVKLSDEANFLLTEALEFCYITNGAYDITVKPLVEIWKIKENMNLPSPSIPTEEEIAIAMDKTDYTGVILENGYISFKKEGMKLDLGGAVKGYAADRATQIIKSYGIKDALINLGGNVYTLGKSEKNTKWKIGLQDPSKQRGEYFTVEELSDKTCVTSGSYERYFKKDGKIYHHIIDPETGYPADNNIISVTVIGDSSFYADMLSTAIFVMGPEKFENIRDNFEFDKYIVVYKDNTWKEY